jgi:hypothetical protein
MTDTASIVTLSVASLAGLAMLIAGGLAGWRGWLEIERLRIAGMRPAAPSADPLPSPAGARIELADLKERVRKLEAIAAGIDL